MGWRNFKFPPLAENGENGEIVTTSPPVDSAYSPHSSYSPSDDFKNKSNQDKEAPEGFSNEYVENGEYVNNRQDFNSTAANDPERKDFGLAGKLFAGPGSQIINQAGVTTNE